MFIFQKINLYLLNRVINEDNIVWRASTKWNKSSPPHICMSQLQFFYLGHSTSFWKTNSFLFTEDTVHTQANIFWFCTWKFALWQKYLHPLFTHMPKPTMPYTWICTPSFGTATMFLVFVVILRVPILLPQTTTRAPWVIFHNPPLKVVVYPSSSSCSTEIKFLFSPWICLKFCIFHVVPFGNLIRTSPLLHYLQRFVVGQINLLEIIIDIILHDFPTISLCAVEWNNALESRIHDSIELWMLKTRASWISFVVVIFTNTCSPLPIFFFGGARQSFRCPFLS